MGRRWWWVPLALLSLAACPGAPDDASRDDVPEAVEETASDLPADVAFEADAEPSGDDGEDEAAPGIPPLSAAEVDLILAAAEDVAMDIVTVETPEGDAFLHEPSLPVDPTDPVVRHLIARMRRTLAASFGGVGLAAPQVGIHRRIFLAQRTDQAGRPVQAFLNPWILEYSAETGAMMEGCLSVPDATPIVTRSLTVVVEYDGEDAAHVPEETIGGPRATQAAYAARIVQHEYDHLDGILISDPRP
jgi:peptide deformylase